jgi:hypothetical protein
MSKKKTYKNILQCGGNVLNATFIIILIAFIAGFLFGSLTVAKSINGGSTAGGSFADGWNAAKAKLKNTNFPGAMFSEVTSLSGQVKSVDGNKIVFSSPLINPLWDSFLKIRTAVVSEKTIIILNTPISREKIQANRQAGQNKITALRTEVEALNVKLVKCLPAEITATSTCGQVRQKINSLQTDMMDAQRLMMGSFSEATGTLADIITGDSISVVSDQNISEKAQFAVKQITISKNPVPVASDTSAASAPAVKQPASAIK